MLPRDPTHAGKVVDLGILSLHDLSQRRDGVEEDLGGRGRRACGLLAASLAADSDRGMNHGRVTSDRIGQPSHRHCLVTSDRIGQPCHLTCHGLSARH